MAVYAAHLTRTLSGTPSVFQVAAQEALGSTIKPALRKVFEYLAAAYPDRLDWSLRWYDELYLLLDTLLQYHYLKHYAASFSESFYGLVRAPAAGGGGGGGGDPAAGARLPAGAELASLALLVAAPYLRGKAEDKVERWRNMRDDGLLGKSRGDRLRSAAIKVYSVVHLAIEWWRLAQLCAFLSRRARSPSPSLALLRLALLPAPPPHVRGLPDRSGWLWLCSALLQGLQYGAFLVQFLRWWDARRPVSARPLPPPPPTTTSSHALYDQSSRYMNKCPICLQPWKIPTVLPMSGYVYCYTCVCMAVRRDRRCAASSLPAAEGSLVRLYLP